jgi:NAD(P)-dependent dehydrogenase (short-subunit alcohol dehydrogenase family)
MTWEGKVAVITGGARGIGGATAELFAQQGAKVVIFDLDPAAEAQLAIIEAAGGTAMLVRGSVACEDDVKALGEAVVAVYGRIDVLVNNAGIMLRHYNAQEWTIDDVRQVLDVNLLGVFMCSYTLAPIMGRTGGGSIVSVSSFGGIMAVPYSPVYSATKAGVLGMTRSMAPSFEPIGVRVNAVLPSLTETAMALASEGAKTMPMLAPMDLARSIVHVAGDTSVNGAFFCCMLTEDGPQLTRLADSPTFERLENSPF